MVYQAPGRVFEPWGLGLCKAQSPGASGLARARGQPRLTRNEPKHFAGPRRRAMATATATVKRMYIDGKWVDADSGRTLAVTNPATEETLAEIAYGGRAETRRALEAAAKARARGLRRT